MKLKLGKCQLFVIVQDKDGISCSRMGPHGDALGLAIHFVTDASECILECKVQHISNVDGVEAIHIDAVLVKTDKRYDMVDSFIQGGRAGRV